MRIDAGVREGDRITPHYDPLIAKLICRGADRGQAIERSLAALRASAIEGIHSNLQFLIKRARASGVSRRRRPYRVRRRAPAASS